MNRKQRMDVISVAVNLFAAWAWLLPLAPRMWSSDDLSGALSGDSDMGDGPRGAVGATLAALRAYRRVSQPASGRLVAPDKTDADTGPDTPETTGVEEFSDNPSRSQMRRNLIFIGGGSALAVAAFFAAVIGVLAAAHPDQARTAIEPYGGVPAATSSAAPASGIAAGRTPRDPVLAGGSARSSTPSGSPTATGSAASVATPGTSGSAAASATATATVSTSLLDLCRTVVAAGSGWPSVLSVADRHTVVAAAGTRKKVLPYCTSMVAGTPTP